MLPAPTTTGIARCFLRKADTDRPLRMFGTYLGRIERFGPLVAGMLELTRERLRFAPDDPGPSPQSPLRGGFDWALEELTAVQPSSSSLQLKARGQPVVSLHFLESSPRLWEERLRAAVQGCYDRLGRGAVVEFQPRIICR